MKAKTKKAFAKRFKFTGTGKIKFKHSGLRHILGFRSRKNKRPLNKTGILSESDRKRVEANIPYGK